MHCFRLWKPIIATEFLPTCTSKMAHLTKAKVYDIEDSNIALLGSDVSCFILSDRVHHIDHLVATYTQLEKHVREHAGEKEPAWKTAGQRQGLEIWRIEKFQVKPWAVEQHGTFYDGDCYIVLNARRSFASNSSFFSLNFLLPC